MGSPTNEDKWRWTLITTIIFLIVVNPYTYIVVNTILSNVGLKISDSTGCPTMIGLAVHTIVFTLLVRLVMEFDV